jgi:hypothetical protein
MICVAFLENVADFVDALVRDLGNVEQAVGAGHDLDERAEVDDARPCRCSLVELRRSR